MHHLLIYFHMYLADRLISHLSLKPRLHFIPLVSKRKQMYAAKQEPLAGDLCQPLWLAVFFFGLTMAFQERPTHICFHTSAFLHLLEVSNAREKEGRGREGMPLLLLGSAREHEVL